MIKKFKREPIATVLIFLIISIVVMAQGTILNKPIISGLMLMRSGVTWDHLGNSWTPKTDSEEDIGSSSVRLKDIYTDSANVSIRLDPDADAGADMGTNALRWNVGFFDELLFNKGADVASTTTSFALGADGNYFVITGTAQIDSIAAKDAGFVAYLQHASTDTLVDGGNLKLAGDFNATADDVIVLVCDGTDWIEISRSAN